MKTLKSVSLYIFLTLAALFILFPFIWMILTAFKVPGTAEKLIFFSNTDKGLLQLEKSDFKAFGIDLNEVQFDLFSRKRLSFYSKNRFPSQKEIDGFLNDFFQVNNLQINDFSFLSKIKAKLDLNTVKKEAILRYTDLSPEIINYLISYREEITDFSNITSLNHLSLFKPKQKKQIKEMFDTSNEVLIQLDRPGFVSLLKLDNFQIEKYQKVRDLGKININNLSSVLNIKALDNQEFELIQKYFFTNTLYTIDNFYRVLFEFEPRKGFTIKTAFLNSLIVSLGTALLTILLCGLAGYVFAKKDFYGKKVIYTLFWASMLIPGMMFVVPQYAIISIFGGVNTFWAMIIPHTANIFGLYLMKQYIEAIPNSLFEAAYIDGANEFAILRIIVLPLIMPIVATLFLMTFLSQWSNFLWQLIVNTPDSMLATLPVTLALFKGQYATDWSVLMAGAVIMLLPIIILFLFSQRYFIQGITAGAVKE